MDLLLCIMASVFVMNTTKLMHQFSDNNIFLELGSLDQARMSRIKIAFHEQYTQRNSTSGVREG